MAVATVTNLRCFKGLLRQSNKLIEKLKGEKRKKERIVCLLYLLCMCLIQVAINSTHWLAYCKCNPFILLNSITVHHTGLNQGQKRNTKQRQTTAIPGSVSLTLTLSLSVVLHQVQ